MDCYIPFNVCFNLGQIKGFKFALRQNKRSPDKTETGGDGLATMNKHAIKIYGVQKKQKTSPQTAASVLYVFSCFVYVDRFGS